MENKWDNNCARWANVAFNHYELHVNKGINCAILIVIIVLKCPTPTLVMKRFSYKLFSFSLYKI